MRLNAEKERYHLSKEVGIVVDMEVDSVLGTEVGTEVDIEGDIVEHNPGEVGNLAAYQSLGREDSQVAVGTLDS